MMLSRRKIARENNLIDENVFRFFFGKRQNSKETMRLNYSYENEMFSLSACAVYTAHRLF